MPIWKWQIYEAPAPGSGETSLENFGLDLALHGYYRDDFSMPLQAAKQASGEILFDLGAYYQSYGPPSGEFLFDLSIVATERANVTMDLAAFVISLSGEDFPFDLYACGNIFSSFSGSFQAAGYEYDDHPMILEAVSPDDRIDICMDLQATDGIVETDMALYLSTIGKVPVFKIIYAQRISSVKSEIT